MAVNPPASQELPTSSVRVVHCSEDEICVTWDQVIGADYYMVFRSDHVFVTFPSDMPRAQILRTTYDDHTGLKENSSYFYDIWAVKRGRNFRVGSVVARTLKEVELPDGPIQIER